MFYLRKLFLLFRTSQAIYYDTIFCTHPDRLHVSFSETVNIQTNTGDGTARLGRRIVAIAN